MTGLLLSDEAPVYFRDKKWPFFNGAIMQCTPINIQMRTPGTHNVFAIKIKFKIKIIKIKFAFKSLQNNFQLISLTSIQKFRKLQTVTI